MPPFETIAAVIAAYVVIIVLLLALNIVSRWRWWVKAGAIVVSGMFFVVSYVAISSLLGWPSFAQVPQRFSLIASRVVEPNKQLGEAGSIFLWLELIDDDNVPSGKPLSYRIAYSDDLARAVVRAQNLIDQGDPVEASLREIAEEVDESKVGSPLAGAGTGSPGDAAEHIEGLNLVFNDMPPVRLPDKGPL